MPRERKYGVVTLERGVWPDPDEPVFVLRGRDALMLQALDDYLVSCEAAGSPGLHLSGVRLVREDVLAWQALHPPHVPGSEPGR
jgi:hypothetical protein